MKRLLYITDQQEYSEHGSIGPLFNGYLRQYIDVHMVYFTKFKHSFQVKGQDYVVPEKYRKEICCYLTAKGIELEGFDFVFVRNMEEVLADVLENRKVYRYKVGFRASFPKTVESYESEKAEAKANWLSSINVWYRTGKKRKLISRCDLFLPISKHMQEAFYGDEHLKCFPLPAGLDPAKIRKHDPVPHDDIRFIYVGTLDTLRQFQSLLGVFTRMAADNWHLTISTRDLTYAGEMIAEYPSIRSKIEIVRAESLDELMDQINACDIGLALLPRLPLFDTSIPSKAMDYYTCAVPAVVTDNLKNRVLFDDHEAIFSDFSDEAILSTLKRLIAMPREEIAAIGEAGQSKILGMKRNYEIMAKELAEVLETL